MGTYKFSDGFKIWPDWTLDCGVSCPCTFGNLHRLIMGGNVVTTLVLKVLNGSSLFRQTRRTTIEAWISLNVIKISSPIIELAPLEHL